MIDDEDAWARTDEMRALAREALEEHRRGETCPLEELLEESPR